LLNRNINYHGIDGEVISFTDVEEPTRGVADEL